jgi:phenylpyruvate tautomerase PptA (4-oxalocrotonate tautomerase family)
VPSLQLDAPCVYDTATRRRLAKQMGRLYAQVMQVVPDIVTVVVRDLGEGHVWRCGPGQPAESALLMCDVRSGRSVQTRAELAQGLIAVCAEHGSLDPSRIKVEFTQHPGADMYHPHLGGFNQDWVADESNS